MTTPIDALRQLVDAIEREREEERAVSEADSAADVASYDALKFDRHDHCPEKTAAQEAKQRTHKALRAARERLLPAHNGVATALGVARSALAAAESPAPASDPDALFRAELALDQISRRRPGTSCLWADEAGALLAELSRLRSQGASPAPFVSIAAALTRLRKLVNDSRPGNGLAFHGALDALEIALAIPCETPHVQVCPYERKWRELRSLLFGMHSSQDNDARFQATLRELCDMPPEPEEQPAPASVPAEGEPTRERDPSGVETVRFRTCTVIHYGHQSNVIRDQWVIAACCGRPAACRADAEEIARALDAAQAGERLREAVRALVECEHANLGAALAYGARWEVCTDCGAVARLGESWRPAGLVEKLEAALSSTDGKERP